MRPKLLIIALAAVSAFAVTGPINVQASTKWHKGTPTALRGKWKTPRMAITAHKADRFNRDIAYYVVKIKATKKAFYFNDGASIGGVPSTVKWRKDGKHTYLLRERAEDGTKQPIHFTVKLHNHHSVSLKMNGYSYWGWTKAGAKIKYLTKY